MSGVPILSILVVLPLIAGIIALFQSANGARRNALITTLVSLALGIWLWTSYVPDGPQWQFVEYYKLGGGIAWAMGIDGIALMLIMLTLFLLPIARCASPAGLARSTRSSRRPMSARIGRRKLSG